MNSEKKSFSKNPFLMKSVFRFKDYFIGNQDGQAVIELSLMMVFLAAVLLAMVILAEFTSKNVSALGRIRHQMRVSMSDNASGDFTRNFKSEDIRADIPGKMKQILKTPFISQTQRIDFYEGSYKGAGINYYQNYGSLIRIVDLQN